MSIHKEESPLAGKTMRIKEGTMHPQNENFGGSDFVVEDWFDRILGKSWMDATGNPAAMIFAMRGAMAQMSIDDEVVYGKVGALGHLVHVSELEEKADG
ncbi:unnamed protein product [marine sediment metagenome]|uniref:Uncharacterized protein n=1 Tax=marine sediment metagenome TaxID=412755 RepID=X0T014_9ZZZZ